MHHASLWTTRKLPMFSVITRRWWLRSGHLWGQNELQLKARLFRWVPGSGDGVGVGVGVGVGFGKVEIKKRVKKS